MEMALDAPLTYEITTYLSSSSDYWGVRTKLSICILKIQIEKKA